jgi:hypothetical protein
VSTGSFLQKKLSQRNISTSSIAISYPVDGLISAGHFPQPTNHVRNYGVSVFLMRDLNKTLHRVPVCFVTVVCPHVIRVPLDGFL